MGENRSSTTSSTPQVILVTHLRSRATFPSMPKTALLRDIHSEVYLFLTFGAEERVAIVHVAVDHTFKRVIQIVIDNDRMERYVRQIASTT